MRTARFSGHGGWCLPGGCTPPVHCMVGYTHITPPLDRILDTRLWKYYLPATTVAGGNKEQKEEMKFISYLHWNSYVEMFVLKQLHFSRSADSPEDEW